MSDDWGPMEGKIDPDLDEWSDEKRLIRNREKRWREERRAVAERVYSTPDGKWFLYYLLEDMRLLDPVTTEAEIVMHNFAIDMLQIYFGALVDNQSHRSMVIEAIMAVERPEEKEDE